MSNTHPVDQIRYCERCGISFLWSREDQIGAEQNEAQNEARSDQSAYAPPSHCPGCRLLLPGVSRERGLVKWYNRRKRFGFFVRRDHPEIYAHGSDLIDGTTLLPGDLVEFSVGEGERGLAAKAIRVINHGDAPTPD